MIHVLYLRLVKWAIVTIEYCTIDRTLSRFYRAASPMNPVVFDVGANSGQTIRLWKRIRPNAVIHSFEANPALIPALRLMEEKHRGVFVHPFGVSNKKGKLELNLNVLDLTSSFESVDVSTGYTKKKAAILGVSTSQLSKEKIEVPVLTLVGVIASLALTHIDILKIDTEGHESKVLQGLFHTSSIATVERIQVEIHLDDMYSGECREGVHSLILANGYEKEVSYRHAFGNFVEVIYRRVV